METSLVVSLVSVGIATWATIRNNTAQTRTAETLKRLEIDAANQRAAEQRQRDVSRFSEPLLRAAYDLQSRIVNALCQGFLGRYLTRGDADEKYYAEANTVFVIAQYFCWAELMRREVQFIDLDSSTRVAALQSRMDEVLGLWGTDKDGDGPLLRVFAGEQRAIGEAMIDTGASTPQCIGYGAFLKRYPPGATSGTDPLIERLRRHVVDLATSPRDGQDRLVRVQNALIGLMDDLDPGKTRFPRARSKVTIVDGKPVLPRQDVPG